MIPEAAPQKTQEHAREEPNEIKAPQSKTHEAVHADVMSANRLARLDSHTGAVTTWDPLNGKYGIMSTAIDRNGYAWFVEQGANYIGRFDPVQQTFRTFPLGTAQGHPLGPQDLQFDAW